MEEISLRELFFILRKRLWLITALFAIAILIAGALSFFVLESEYETFTTLMIGKPEDYRRDNQLEYNDLLLNQKLVSTYGELVKSRQVTDQVIDNLNLDVSYNTFRNMVSVNLINDTEIIQILARHNSPVMAAQIANETAEVFMDSVQSIMMIENVQIIDEAQVPENPVKPRPILNIAIAAVLGIMSGVFLAFLLEFLDNTIKSPEDVERHLELPVIGAIPLMKERNSGLISLTDPKSPITEAFRTLRTNIQFSSVDKKIKTIIVTSSSPTEGKSIISTNLASIVAQSDKKVLLVDCDLRKPKIHENFLLSNQEGLTNLLVGESNISAVANKYQYIEKMDIITSGPIPPNPAEMLGSNSMKEFLDQAKGEYDLIILDSPPIGLVTDSAVLSSIADAVIYVTAVGQTDKEVVINSKELLDRVNANIIGVVLNKIPTDKKSYYSYNYQYYNYYGENEEKSSKKAKKKRRKRR